MTAIYSKFPTQAQPSPTPSAHPKEPPPKNPGTPATDLDFFSSLVNTLIPAASLMPLAARLAKEFPKAGASGISAKDPQNFFEEESRSLDNLEDQLLGTLAESPEVALEQLKLVEALAQQYLQLGAHEEGNSSQLLAERTYNLLEKVAGNSPYVEIQQRAPLYSAYHKLAQGDLEGAKAAFTELEPEFDEAWEIVKRMKSDELRVRNLKALYAWEVFTEEGKEHALDEAHGFGGIASGMITKLVEDKTTDDFVYEKVQIERDLIAKVREQIQNGKAKTIDDALLDIEEPRLKPRAHDLLTQRRMGCDDGSYLIAHMIRYVSETHPSAVNGYALFRDADQMGARGGVQTAYAMYSLLRETAPTEDLKNSSAEKIATLENGKSLGSRLWDMIRTTSLDEVAFEILVMKGCQTLGALAKLATLNKLSKLGVTGYKASALAFGAEVLAEGGAFGTMQLAQEAAEHDVGKVLTAEHILKVYASNLIMIGGLKEFGSLSSKYAPRAARALDMVVKGGGGLSKGGKIFVGALNHAAGLGGMVAGNQANQALGLSERPEDGFLESLAHDAFNYLKYGIAAKGLDGVMGPKLARKSFMLQAEGSYRQAALRIEANMKALGHDPVLRTPEGIPVFKDPEVQGFYTQLILQSLLRPGFDAGKLTRLRSEGKIGEAQKYAKSFGLALDCELVVSPPPSPDLTKVTEAIFKTGLLGALLLPETAEAGQGGMGMGVTEMGMILGVGALLGAGFLAKPLRAWIKSRSQSQTKAVETKAKAETSKNDTALKTIGLGIGLGALLGPKTAEAMTDSFLALDGQDGFARFVLSIGLGFGLLGMAKIKPRGIGDLFDLSSENGPFRKKGATGLKEIEVTSRHVNGAPRNVELKEAKALGEDVLPAGTRLYYGENGRLRAIRPNQAIRFGGVEYGYGDQLFFNSEAQLEFAVLEESREIQGFDCEAQFPIFFYASGKVARLKLASKQVRLEGVFRQGEVVDIKDGVMLHEENVLKHMLWTATSGLGMLFSGTLLASANFSSFLSSALGVVNLVATAGSLYHFTRELNWMKEQIPRLPEDLFPGSFRIATGTNRVPLKKVEVLENKESSAEAEMEAEQKAELEAELEFGKKRLPRVKSDHFYQGDNH